MPEFPLIIQRCEDAHAPLAICIMGPTATGKTGLAMRLVEQYDAAIISVDSAMVFRGMDIGTAKPDAATLARVPHRLIDILDPSESYSAARFREDALLEIADIISSGYTPVLVGGTMLYFRALIDGISELPGADSDVRNSLEAEARRIGWPAMHNRLAEIDPQGAKRIHPNDPQRIQRALEVFELTGQSLSDHWEAEKKPAIPYNLLKIALMPPHREELSANIKSRFEHMLESGFIDEVRALYGRGDLDADLPSMRAVGYRQIWEHLDGTGDSSGDLDTLREKALAATRQLAKRQMTWLRKESQCNFFDPYSVNLDEVLKNVKICLHSWQGGRK